MQATHSDTMTESTRATPVLFESTVSVIDVGVDPVLSDRCIQLGWWVVIHASEAALPQLRTVKLELVSPAGATVQTFVEKQSAPGVLGWVTVTVTDGVPAVVIVTAAVRTAPLKFSFAENTNVVGVVPDEADSVSQVALWDAVHASSPAVPQLVTRTVSLALPVASKKQVSGWAQSFG